MAKQRKIIGTGITAREIVVCDGEDVQPAMVEFFQSGRLIVKRAAGITVRLRCISSNGVTRSLPIPVVVPTKRIVPSILPNVLSVVTKLHRPRLDAVMRMRRHGLPMMLASSPLKRK